MSDLRPLIADHLDALAKQLGDEAFARAAAVLRADRAGRAEIDDSRWLAMAESLYRDGAARSLHDACTIIANLAALAAGQPHSVPAIRDRLRRKLRPRVA